MPSDTETALDRLKNALYINDGDTLSAAAGDKRVVWIASGSWSPSQPITIGDIREVVAALTPTDTDTAMPAEPFGYWVTQKGADPLLLRRPSYIPEPSELRTITPLYAASPKPDTDTEKRCSTCGETNDALFCSNGFHAMWKPPVDPGVEGVREARRLARTAFALEVSQIDRGALLTGLTDDEIDSIIDGVLSAAALAAKPIAGTDAGEVAWREGWSGAKACLTDDEAFCLTVDVEEDAWRDSATRAALATNQEDGK